jgi:hypothetical protein
MIKLIEWIKGGISYSDGTMDTEVMIALTTVATFLALSITSALQGKGWDPQTFGIGGASLFGGLGVLLKFRKTE